MPGAYGRYLKRSTPRNREYVGSPGALGQTTATRNPAATSDWHSSQTRRSNGTDRFCTSMRTRPRFCAADRRRTVPPLSPLFVRSLSPVAYQANPS